MAVLHQKLILITVFDAANFTDNQRQGVHVFRTCFEACAFKPCALSCWQVDGTVVQKGHELSTEILNQT